VKLALDNKDMMKRQYYSQRTNPKKLTLIGVCIKFTSVYELLAEKDYFKEELDIRRGVSVSEEAKHNAIIELDFQPFPIDEWDDKKLTEENLFDTIEYLYDKISKPGEIEDLVSESGYNYWDYESYDKAAGKKEYRGYMNSFLSRYRDGYELLGDGRILSLGSDGIQHVLEADLPVLGEKNIDAKVKEAIEKWRNRELNLNSRREAIRDLADVFEWLKSSDMLKNVLNKRDESVIFEIANKFAFRHHNPKQIQNYDKSIWYSWIFHFYLATFHAVSRMIAKNKKYSPTKS